MVVTNPLLSLCVRFFSELIFRKGRDGQFKRYSTVLLGLRVTKPFTKGSVA